ncbi:DUF4382 domain-containing protein [Carboxylicivirga sp. A043]|uniref:DUF4382 domain-containing protein n=1 Tax=Carboxylicivirga litoralis TaxID=2816963 RepID=UPI0021CB0843|nr:DUF4382 domain-containing protein [Carboxylicivirga sp. A043]MCU4154560.1 DUF4382 domain-containing protein [Carboxylicivirga sp. A043]
MDGKQLIALVAIVMSSLFMACSNDDGHSSTGTLKINLTDAPFPTDLVAEANVTINKIEIRNAEDEEEGPFIVVSEEEMSFNLLDLTNGVTAGLVDLEIEAGEYDLIRLYVSEASIVLKDGTEHSLKVPSGSQTGIKIFLNPALVVTGGLTSELLLDMDVSKSFVLKGDFSSPEGINGFNFKPTIKASNMSTAGRLTGVVTDADQVAIEGVQVSIMMGEEVYTTSFTDAEGNYAVLGVDAGSYSVVFEKEGYEQVVVEAVEIIAANKTTQDAQLTAIETTEEPTE